MNFGRAWFCALLAGQGGGAGAEDNALFQKVSSIHNGTFLLQIPLASPQQHRAGRFGQ